MKKLVNRDHKESDQKITNLKKKINTSEMVSCNFKDDDKKNSSFYNMKKKVLINVKSNHKEKIR